MSAKPHRPRHRATPRLAGFVALSFAILLVGAAQAFAATVTDRPFLFSFDGTDTSAGHLVKPNKIAIDNSNGDVYVSEGEDNPEWRLNEAVSKFNPDGTAAVFSATGKSSLFLAPESADPRVSEVSIAVDNSGTSSQGRLYVATERKVATLRAFAPSGTLLWEIPEVGSSPEDVAVDQQGHVWLLLGGNTVREYANTGSPPAQIGSFPVSKGPHGLDIGANGNAYLAGFSGVDEYIGGVIGSTLDPSGSLDVFADQSSVSGHVFTSHWETGDFNEYDSGGTLVGAYGAGAIDAARGIAYSKALDRVYIANQGLSIVEAFGPPITGTVPDPTIEATTASGPGTATFHGTINPQGVTNAYYFEWAGGVESSPFGNAHARIFRSPLQSLPEDSSPHAVQYKATNVSGNINWFVRLVTVNTANGLRAVSGTDTFKPSKAAAAPVVTIDPIEKEPVAPCTTGITAEEACVSGTVNPKNDSVKLKIETSDGSNCTAFSSHTNEFIYIPGGEINTPIEFHYDLKKLAPSEPYCVRIEASNSFGASGPSETREFDTPQPAPSEVSSAFAAPLTDTTARINGRVNPEGNADFEYRFELSEEGAGWHELPPGESSLDAHEAIVVADELKGLKPDTTYHFRLASAKNEAGLTKNEAGPGASADERTFTTRTAAEMTLPPNAFGEPEKRGIELVNNPDKGNQDVFFETISEGVSGEVSFVAPDGQQVRWFVTAGAPGSPNGVGGQFLAERGPGGWQSQSLVPPAAGQFGDGSLVYNLTVATPDQSHFIADLRTPGLRSTPESTLVRLDTHQHEEVLHTFKWPFEGESLGGTDVSDDGAHVLTVDPGTEGLSSKQLVDIGTGEPEIVSWMPDETLSGCGLHTVSGAEAVQGLQASFVGAPQWRPGYHMMATTDSNLVYFRAKPNGECGKPWGLYVRDRAADKTTLIDLGAGGQNVEFIRATPDGRHGYFLTDSKLDPADQNADTDLYRWDQGTKESTCLTCVVPDASILAGTNSLSQVMISDDFSHAYFESHKLLVPGEGVKGAENLYALSGGTVRFVAALEGENAEALERQNARLSADGNALVFRSSAAASPRLTADSVSCGAECKQIYRYEDREGSLECLSCAPSGITTTAPSGAGGGTGSDRGTFDISADGSTVGFVTRQALTRLDVNGGADVYEWRGGVRRLLTDGVSEAQTSLAAPGVRGVDADGSNILFSVAEPGLTGFESDELANLYDARIGGGFEPPSPPVHCSEDSCQGPLQAAPGVPPAGSSTYSGPGNLKEGSTKSRCARAKVRRHGRCVSRHDHKHRHRATGANRRRSK